VVHALPEDTPLRPALLASVLVALIHRPAGAQFTAPLPTRSTEQPGAYARTAVTDNDAPNLLLPQIGTGFSSDRAYVVATAFTGRGTVPRLGVPFGIDVSAAKVVATSDDQDPTKRQEIRDTKSLVTTLIENSGSVAARLYGCPGGCTPVSDTQFAHNLLLGLAAGSYSLPDATSGSDPKLAVGPIAQLYGAIRLTGPSSNTPIGYLLLGARVGAVTLTGGGISSVSDGHVVRCASETLALLANNVVLFGVTLTQTQSSLSSFVPGIQVTTTVSVK
jgi:hypothetical protein